MQARQDKSALNLNKHRYKTWNSANVNAELYVFVANWSINLCVLQSMKIFFRRFMDVTSLFLQQKFFEFVQGFFLLFRFDAMRSAKRGNFNDLCKQR